MHIVNERKKSNNNNKNLSNTYKPNGENVTLFWLGEKTKLEN